jgi:hypothetical protein
MFTRSNFQMEERENDAFRRGPEEAADNPTEDPSAASLFTQTDGR